MVRINQSLIESSMFFFQLKLLIYCIYFSKAYDLVLVVDPFFAHAEPSGDH